MFVGLGGDKMFVNLQIISSPIPKKIDLYINISPSKYNQYDLYTLNYIIT